MLALPRIFAIAFNTYREAARARLLLGVMDRVRTAHGGEGVDAIDLARDLGDGRADLERSHSGHRRMYPPPNLANSLLI